MTFLGSIYSEMSLPTKMKDEGKVTKVNNPEF